YYLHYGCAGRSGYPAPSRPEPPMPVRCLPARRRLGLAIVALFALPAAQAQTQLPSAGAPAAAALDRVQVQAPIPQDSGTATRTATPLNEIPQSISVITDRHMRDRGIHGIEEAVWFTEIGRA